jgi:hypothetical protein
LGVDCYAAVDTTKEVLYRYYGNNQFNSISAADTSNFIRTNKWMTVVFAYDSSGARIYVDGILKRMVTGPVPFTPNNNDLFIGRAENPAYPYWFNGVIDEIRIYNKALCPGAIKQSSALQN